MQKSGYNPDLAATILKRVSESETLRQVARDEGGTGVPESSIREWARSDVEGFAGWYARARTMQIDSWANELVSVAYDERLDPADKRVRCDQLRWLLSKLAPRRFGDRLLVGSDPDAPVQILHKIVSLDALSNDQLGAPERFTAAMVEAQG